MTRLGQFITTLAATATLATLLPAAAGSAFAQPAHAERYVYVPPVDVHVPPVSVQAPHVGVDVQVPPVDVHVPEIDVHVPDMDFNFDFDYDWGKVDWGRFDWGHMAADIAEAGRLAQNGLTEQQRKDIEKATEKAREAADRVREDMHEQMTRSMRRCDERGRDGDTDRLYDCGRAALDNSQWDRAIDYFGRVAAAKTDRADGALYWKAYAQNKAGQRTEALATIADFKANYAKSRWANDVSTLEVDVRQKSGQPVKPGETTDDETKLYVLQNMMGNSSAEVVPILEKLVTGPQSPKVKDRALFVLAQSGQPTARAVVIKVAKGGANPELQARAVRYLGEFNTPESRQALAEIYTSTTDLNVKKNVLRGYMQSGDREHLLAAAKSESNPQLRLEAIRELGNIGAVDGLAELYAKESSPDVKKAIIRGFANSGNADKLMTIAQSEPDAELRRNAVRTLGTMGKTETGPRLVALYEKEQNADVKKTVIDGLFIQGNATAMVGLARKEQDPALKQELVRKLSVMNNKEANEYLISLLK
jgi:HEAT repeat protein